MVVGGEREVGHAAHQASAVLPVGVQGDFLHAAFGETSADRRQLIAARTSTGRVLHAHDDLHTSTHEEDKDFGVEVSVTYQRIRAR